MNLGVAEILLYKTELQAPGSGLQATGDTQVCFMYLSSQFPWNSGYPLFYGVHGVLLVNDEVQVEGTYNTF